MPNLNKVLLMGNLTRDPEMRYTPNNTAVTKIGLAVNRRRRDQEGNLIDDTTFVDCTAFARTAEVINEYFQKGRPIFIEGRLNLNQWEDKEGNRRSKLEVIIESFEFLTGRDDNQGGGGGGGGGRRSSGGSRGNQGYSGSRGYQGSGNDAQGGGGNYDNGGSSGGGNYGGDDGGHAPMDDDDIPF